MEKLGLDDFDQELPSKYSIAVVMERRVSSHAWANFSFQAIGIIAQQGESEHSVKNIYSSDTIEHYLVSGLTLRLFVDECESYYHNMMSPKPSCFIVADQNEDLDEMPVPHLVSLSFDEAHSYLEGDQQVYSVEIPVELYKWLEAYVLTHYVAIKKTKRKLKDWRETEQPSPESLAAARTNPSR